MKISFTTLACPDWNWEHVLEEAARLSYDGIELRFVEGEMYLPSSRPFKPEHLQQTINQIEASGLTISCLDTSCSFHDPSRIEAAIAEGEAYIELAQKLKAPYIRVFGDAIPDQAREDETIAEVAQALERLGRYAENKGVVVLLEAHGGFSASDRLLAVMEQTRSEAVGILWDINNPLKHAGESMKMTYSKLARYIKHTHIKDSQGTGTDEILKLPGEGDVPIQECLDLLRDAGYDGWLSFEWEKKWHPQLEEPEIALPAYIAYIKNRMGQVNG